MRKEVEQALEWLTPAFTWATSGWAAEQSWPEAKPAFLAAVGLESADPDQPGHRLVVRFVEYVDTQLPDAERRRFLNDPSARTDVVDMFAEGDYESGAEGDYESGAEGDYESGAEGDYESGAEGDYASCAGGDYASARTEANLP